MNNFCKFILLKILFSLSLSLFSGCTFLGWGKKTTPPPPTPAPTPVRPYNEKRLPIRYFHSWHRSKPGMIMTEGEIKNYYLGQPDGQPVNFAEYKVERYKSDDHWKSNSGKYAVDMIKKNERSENRGCCAIQVFDYDVILRDLENPANYVVLLENASSVWQIKGWSPDDNYILFEGEGNLFLLNRETREKTVVVSKPSNVKFVFTPDGKGLLFTAFTGEQTNLELLDLAAKQSKTLLPALGNDSQIRLSPDGKTLALFKVTITGETTLTANNQLYLFNAETGEQAKLYELPTGNIRLGEGEIWKKDGSEIAFSVGGKDYAVDVYSVSLKDGKLTRWYPPQGETTALYLPE